MNKIDNYNLVSRFNEILNYQLSSTILLALSYFHGIALILTSIAAILFAPYMVYVLIKGQRYGWLTSFIILIILPIVISLIAGIKSENLSIVLLLTLLLFYLYCFVIKYVVTDWLKDYTWAQQLAEQKREKEEYQNKISNSKNINDILNM